MRWFYQMSVLATDVSAWASTSFSTNYYTTEMVKLPDLANSNISILLAMWIAKCSNI